MSVIKRILAETLTWKWLFFILYLGLYTWHIRTRVHSDSQVYGLDFNAWDVIVTALQDPFLTIYLLLPLWLFLSAYLVIEEWEATLLIRLKNFRGWVLHTLLRVCPMLAVLMSLWVMIILLITIGVPYEMGWSPLASDPSSGNYLSIFAFPLMEAGLSPWLAAILQLFIFTLFLLTLHVLMATLYVFVPKMKTVAGLGLFLFIGTIFAFKFGLPQGWLWVKTTNYFILVSSYSTFHSLFPALLAPFVLIAIYLGLASLRQKQLTVHVRTFFTENIRFIVYGVTVLFGLTLSLPYAGVQSLTVWDDLYIRFYGVSQAGYSLPIYLYSCLMYLGFAYLFQLALSEMLNGPVYYLVIRYSSLMSWFRILFAKTALAALVLLALLNGITVLLGYMRGEVMAFRLTVIPDVALSELVYSFWVNGFLQLLNYTLLLLIVTWVWRDAVYGLVALGVLMVLGLPGINIGQWLPAGLNSLGYVTGGPVSVFRYTLVLIFYLVIEFSIMIYLFRKRSISF